MRSRVKVLCLVGLLTILLGLFPACASLSCTSSPRTRLTDQQAAAIVAFGAVPSINYYLKQLGQPLIEYQVSATGDWKAVYGEGSTWTVEGQVMVLYPSGDKTCATTWTVNDADGTMKLVKFVCP